MFTQSAINSACLTPRALTAEQGREEFGLVCIFSLATIGSLTLCDRVSTNVSEPRYLGAWLCMLIGVARGSAGIKFGLFSQCVWSKTDLPPNRSRQATTNPLVHFQVHV